MSTKSLLVRALYWARNLRSREMFAAMKRYCTGTVLDVGGWDFFLAARARGIPCRRWITLERSKEHRLRIDDPSFGLLHGDGCRLPFASGSFDTVLNIQVLEHVMEPIAMVQESSRVLRPGGHGVFLIPQTATIHLAPQHYYNFTRFWIEEVMSRSGLEIIHLQPLGGVWSSAASHMIYFFLQSVRFPGMSTPECKRGPLFYVLYPFMVIYAALGTPLCLLLSLGDLTEEPNNHLVVVRKP